MDTSNWRLTEDASGAVGDPTMEFGDWRTQLQREKTVNKIMDILKMHLPFSRYERLQDLKKIAERVEDEIYIVATSQSEYSRKICLNMLTIETRLQNPISDYMQSNDNDWQEEVYRKIKTMKFLYACGADSDTHWRARLPADSRQRIANKITKHLQRFLPFFGHVELHALAVRLENKIYNLATCQYDYLRRISLKMILMEARYVPIMSNSSINPPVQSMHNNIGSTGMQASSSLSFALPPGSSLHQPTMASVAGPSSSLQHIPNMSSVQQNQLNCDTRMESDDWREHVQAGSRERIKNRILDTLKRHLPYCGDEALHELRKIVERFEERIYAAAISQSDYIRKISLKMLTMETRPQYPNPMPSNSEGNIVNL